MLNSRMTKEEISSALQSFLSRCSISYRKLPIDPLLLKLCYKEATDKGYLTEDSQEFKPFIPQGLILSGPCYDHIEHTSVKVWMAFVTGALIYGDDIFEKDIASAATFCQRLLRGKPQEDRILDILASLLTDVPSCFPAVTANLMVVSILNWVNAAILEDKAREMKFNAAADNYPMFTRIMSGASELYALAAFPPELPIESFIQALPSIMVFIVDGNDALSFYKEEIIYEESGNHISTLANSRGWEKRRAFNSVIDETVKAHEKALRILDSDKAALEAYKRFAAGYVYFHAGLDVRYHLDDLTLV
ncbi:hypothetical protein D9757_013073 [Collybiopsis confluens]|uniref:Terpenoid synthase n=1 Tax=Collybiopsis confluens TaxID=2823264 RepID=A0A8H5FVG0_9AGAR|nr:hypothetical protein D9757_013073 [Collybiopsis confluens]